MASTPAFATTVNVGSALVPSTLDTSLTAPTHVSTVLTAGANGSKIEEITAIGVGTTVAANLNIFRYDGATYHLIDQFAVSAVTSSTTATAYFNTKRYFNLFLKSGDTLVVTITVAGDQSLIKVTAFGADF